MTENKRKNKQLENFGETFRMWKPGQSGNPNGRPKGKKDGLRARVNRLLKRHSFPQVIKILEAKGCDLDQDSHADVIAGMMVIKAISGDLKAIKLIADIT